ncbi:organic cation/carnitine transporter 2-like [Dermacentor variabilis]|uniref:organic cation/carnitine transporter 2-like n=1 Tax=Dermacentor variabilis TaxID=34621 RepID=UPI003F5BEC0F
MHERTTWIPSFKRISNHLSTVSGPAARTKEKCPGAKESQLRAKETELQRWQSSDGAQVCVPFGDGVFQAKLLIVTAVADTIALTQARLFRSSMRGLDHWGARPPGFSNTSVDAWKALAIPRDADGNYSRCTVREPPDAGDSARVVACDAWEFNLSDHGNTVVSESNLVCQQSWLSNVAHVVVVCANVLSLPLVGMAAHRAGRKTVTFSGTMGLLLTLGVSSMASYVKTFVVTQAAVSVLSKCMGVQYVLLNEVTMASRRLLYCFVAPTLSSVFVPVLLYLVRSYQLDWALSQVVVATLALVLLASFYVVEGSPTWLLATHNIEEAERAVRRARGVNKVSQSDARRQLGGEMESYRREQDDLLSDENVRLLRSLWLRERTFMLAFVWLVLSWAYSHHVEERGLTSVIYVRSATLIGLGPKFVFAWPVLDYYGGVRRAVAISTLVFATSSVVAFAAHTDEASPWQDILYIFMRVSLTLPVAFLFFLTISLYPPILRCEAGLLGYACAIAGDNAGYIAFTRLLGRRQDAALAIQSLLTALVAVAIANLPLDDQHDASWRRSLVAQRKNSSITSTRQTSAVAIFERPTLLDPMPEQFIISAGMLNSGR